MSKQERGELVDLAGFIVWRSLAVEGEYPDFEQLADIPFAPVETEGPAPQRYQHLDRDVNPGDKYDYYVTAYNTDEREGMPSPLLRVTYIGESSVVVGRRR